MRCYGPPQEGFGRQGAKTLTQNMDRADLHTTLSALSRDPAVSRSPPPSLTPHASSPRSVRRPLRWLSASTWKVANIERVSPMCGRKTSSVIPSPRIKWNMRRLSLTRMSLTAQERITSFRHVGSPAAAVLNMRL